MTNLLNLSLHEILKLDTEQVKPLIEKLLETPTQDNLAALYYITKNNPVVFSELFCHIPKLGASIKLNKAQKLLMKTFYTNHFIYTIGSRQVGKTTAMELLVTHVLEHYPSYNVLFLTLTDKQATDTYTNIKGIMENMPKLWPQIGKPTRGRRITLTNKSYFLAIPIQKSKDVSGQIKGLSPYFLIVDEFPDIKRNNELLAKGIPALQTRFIIAQQNNYPYGIILSGNAVRLGTENALFAFKLWQQTIASQTQYVPIVFYYRDLLPEEEANRIIQDAKLSGMSETDILVEYECMFLPDKNALLTDDLIRSIKPERPKFVLYPDSQIPLNLHVDNVKDIAETFVVVGVDTATMYGEDYYTITGIDYFTHEQLFEWHGKVRVDEVMNVLNYIARYIVRYGTVVIERNQGQYLIEMLLAQDYEFWSHKLFSKKEKRSEIFGFWTDKNKKKLAFTILLSELYKNPLIIKSQELFRELLLVQHKSGTGTIGVDPAYGHDDAVMAFVIALYVATQEEETLQYKYAQEITNTKRFKQQTDTVEIQKDTYIQDEIKETIDSILQKEKVNINIQQYDDLMYNNDSVLDILVDIMLRKDEQTNLFPNIFPQRLF